MEVPRIVKDSLAIESLLKQRDQLRVELDAARKQRAECEDHLKAELAIIKGERDGWCELAIKYRDERDKLHGALEEVEFVWVDAGWGSTRRECPWCGMNDGHGPDCARQAALATGENDG